jgi:2-amino-4-hydroxy-6-hydroxymethyldihydropteridine diphosphokinase
MLRAFIGLGSNLANETGDSRQIMSDAIRALNRLAIGPVRVSSLYSSSPMGPEDQPDYLNAVALFFTGLLPHSLLDDLQQLERDAGRMRLRHWGERTLDLDILIMDHGGSKPQQPLQSSSSAQPDAMIKLSDGRLVLPHIGILDRAFVVQPLLELDANLSIEQISLADCAAASTTHGIRVVSAVGWNE